MEILSVWIGSSAGSQLDDLPYMFNSSAFLPCWWKCETVSLQFIGRVGFILEQRSTQNNAKTRNISSLLINLAQYNGGCKLCKFSLLLVAWIQVAVVYCITLVLLWCILLRCIDVIIVFYFVLTLTILR